MILKKARYANTKLYLPKPTVPRYLARYIVTIKDIILKITSPAIMMPVFFATLCTVLKRITYCYDMMLDINKPFCFAKAFTQQTLRKFNLGSIYLLLRLGIQIHHVYLFSPLPPSPFPPYPSFHGWVGSYQNKISECMNITC